jgi:hypothetical protein
LTLLPSKLIQLCFFFFGVFEKREKKVRFIFFGGGGGGGIIIISLKRLKGYEGYVLIYLNIH